MIQATEINTVFETCRILGILYIYFKSHDHPFIFTFYLPTQRFDIISLLIQAAPLLIRVLMGEHAMMVSARVRLIMAESVAIMQLVRSTTGLCIFSLGI